MGRAIFVQPDLARIEDKLSRPMDVERELWEAARYRIVDGRRVRTIAGGSLLAPMPSDLIYANVADGTQVNTFTAETQLNPNPAPILPANFVDRTYGVGKTLRVVARGILGGAVAAPSFVFGSRIDSTTGVILATMTSSSVVTSATNAGWEMEFDLVFRAVGTAGSAKAQGVFSSPALNPVAASTIGPSEAMLASAAAWGTPTPAAVTIDTTAAHTILVDASCSASSASNLVQLLQLLVMALN